MQDYETRLSILKQKKYNAKHYMYLRYNQMHDDVLRIIQSDFSDDVKKTMFSSIHEKYMKEIYELGANFNRRESIYLQFLKI